MSREAFHAKPVGWTRKQNLLTYDPVNVVFVMQAEPENGHESVALYTQDQLDMTVATKDARIEDLEYEAAREEGYHMAEVAELRGDLISADARIAELESQLTVTDDRDRTHSDGCWRWHRHHACAIARVEELQEKARLLDSLTAQIKVSMESGLSLVRIDDVFLAGNLEVRDE